VQSRRLDGVGFDDANERCLFEPFQRLHGARVEGSGIGLSIVKRMGP
jgi:signal transduction histidine kinase